MDLSVHKLNFISDILAMRAKNPEKFDVYTNRVCEIIYGLHPGDRYKIEKVPINSQPVFIKIVCMLITEGTDVLFTDDFTEIFCPLPAPVIMIKEMPLSS